MPRGHTRTSSCTQLRTLLRKRLTVATRDPKGFFFQVVLPVLLISLVLLVLTIDVRLSGPPIAMRASLYQDFYRKRSGSARFGEHTEVLFTSSTSATPSTPVTTAAIPMLSMVALIALWFGVSVPLVFLGAFFGY